MLPPSGSRPSPLPSFSESPPSTTTAPPACCATARSSRPRRRSASPARRATPRFPAHAVAYCLREGGIDVPDLDVRRLLRQAAAQVRAHPGDLSRRRAARLRVVPEGRAALDQGEALSPTASSATRSAATTGDAPLRRASRVARGERVLPVAVRGGGDPHDGRRRRVGDGVDRRRARATSSSSCKELHWPDSLGLLYSAFTYYTGFKVNSGEYKVMGLAPYGEPKYVDADLPRADRPARGRLVHAEPGVLQLPGRPHHDERRLRRAVRRPAARARDAS